VRIGDRSVDVAVPPALPVYEVLRAAGVDLGDPHLMIVDSTGRQLDLYSTTGDQLPDGSVLHVLARAGRARASGRSAAAAQDPASARPTAAPWWLAVAGGAAVVLVATIGLDASAGAGAPGSGGGFAPDLDLGLGAAGRSALAAVLAVAALSLALAVARRRAGSAASAWATVTAALLGAAAGVTTVDPTLPGAGRLMTLAALVAATGVVAVRWAVARRSGGEAADVAAVLALGLACPAAVVAAVLFAGLPGSFAAAILLGAVPLGLRVLPGLCVEVPTEQLLDVAQVARTAVGVRAPQPRPLGPVNDRMVHRSVRSAERRRDAGTVVLSVVAPAAAGLVLLAAGPGRLTGTAALVACSFVVLVLGLQPRSTRGALARWAPRLGAAAVLVEVGALAGARADVLGTVAALVVGLAVAAVSLPVGRGWRSVGVSRLADGFEGLATVLALPAALVAAGAIETFRQVTSG
jgi:hypothetical protein